MSRKNVEGHCRICGKNGKLSFEHVPPKKCFNTGKYYEVSIEKFLGIDIKSVDELAKIKGKVGQGGLGFYSLCVSCNNLTGHRYGDEFANWSFFWKAHIE